MATPPLRTALSDTYPNPSNAIMRTGMGALWDYVTTLLGATGTPADARAALGAAASGANSDITSLIGLTTALSEAQGGTGATTVLAAVKTAANASGSAPIYACRAWVNFNGTGTVAIRASGNVSSITDNGTGDYTVNLTTAMPDANYCPTVGAANAVTNVSAANNFDALATGSFALRHVENNAAADSPQLYVAIFR